jgi:hypothetical protein
MGRGLFQAGLLSACGAPVPEPPSLRRAAPIQRSALRPGVDGGGSLGYGGG